MLYIFLGKPIVINTGLLYGGSKIFKKDFDDGSEVSGEDQTSSEDEKVVRKPQKGKAKKKIE